MKKIAILALIVIVVWVGYKFYQENNPNRMSQIEKEIQYKAYKDLNDGRRKYGSYKQGNEDLDKMIEIEFQMKDWNFGWQQPFDMVKTEDSDLPFVATQEIAFINPNNENVIRELTKVYIYDSDKFDWIPLKTSLKEMNLESGELSVINDSRIWQGDWEIPFFEE
jgi:hypothetical protein